MEKLATDVFKTAQVAPLEVMWVVAALIAGIIIGARYTPPRERFHRCQICRKGHESHLHESFIDWDGVVHRLG